jgi:serine O-acetyltransferase
MIYRFPLRNVKDMLLNQISNNFFKSIDDERLITKHLPKALERFEACISKVDNKYYYQVNKNGEREAYFDPLHTCQWLLFLYLVANTIYKYENEKKEAARVVCDKIYGQSKTVSGCDLYYEIEMPEVFTFDHPTGSFMGRAKFGEYFSFTQGCSVGNSNEIYPVIGEHVSMYAGSKILGNSHIGDNCIISAGTMVKDQDVPANSIVYGKSPELVIKHKD